MWPSYVRLAQQTIGQMCCWPVCRWPWPEWFYIDTVKLDVKWWSIVGWSMREGNMSIWTLLQPPSVQMPQQEYFNHFSELKLQWRTVSEQALRGFKGQISGFCWTYLWWSFRGPQIRQNYWKWPFTKEWGSIYLLENENIWKTLHFVKFYFQHACDTYSSSNHIRDQNHCKILQNWHISHHIIILMGKISTSFNDIGWPESRFI